MAQHNTLGLAGEEAAARYLMFRNYSIRERNWRCGRLEIDIIAERYGLLVFVEVKSRRNESYGSPAEAVDRQKMLHTLTAANAYIRLHRLVMPVRFDIVAVIGEQPPFRIEHIRDAFRPGLPDIHPAES